MTKEEKQTKKLAKKEAKSEKKEAKAEKANAKYKAKAEKKHAKAYASFVKDTEKKNAKLQAKAQKDGMNLFLSQFLMLMNIKQRRKSRLKRLQLKHTESMLRN